MREIDPMATSRAYAFEMWMNAPMPMVTFFRTLDVSALVKAGKKKRLEIQYAYVLVYRKGGERNQGILYVACGQKSDSI